MTTVPFVVLNRAGSTQKAARPSAVYSLFVEKGLDKLKTRVYHKITVRISINGTRTYAQIASDIQADNPVAFIGSNMNDGGATAHAFLCRGYYDSGDYSYYSVWNPWYNKYEIIYSKDNIYTSASGNYKYKWARTVFNWADAYRSASLDS